MKKLFLYILGLLFLLGFVFCGTNLSGNQNFVNAANSEPFVETFEVGKYLKVEGGQTYLDDPEKEIDGQGGIVYFITELIELLTRVIASFALLFIIIGGIVMMVSHGNSQMQTRGKQILLYSVIGLVVAFTSLLLVTFVQSLFFTA